ncbi:MAG TPA: hypothetical protein VLA34_10685, partial [Candidatus Krumholzibacterium sp.]|nr:hypothetical protein [Candidatus Krumholzibacterium sp.]
DLGNILLHRGIYFVFGLSFISFTIVMLKRLPQSRAVTGLARLSSFALLAVAVAMMVAYVGKIRAGSSLREQISALGDSYADSPVLTVTGYDISLAHQGPAISATAAMKIRNDTPGPVEKYVFNLNPGLAVKDDGGTGRYAVSRELQVVTVDPGRPLMPGGVDSFEISYEGIIDERACYPDILESDREKALRLEHAGMVNMGKRYSFVTPDYVLLTPESGWYPVPGPGYIPSRPEARPRRLADFSLEVRTRPGLTAVSQGAARSEGDGAFSFHPEYPLPSLALSIGKYEYRSIEVDSVEYGLYIFEGHDFFSDYFTEIGDTLQSVIRDMANDTENKLGLEYPYKRLTLLEVPIHFYSYRRLWSVAQETVQPEIVLLPEAGLPLRGVDFRMIEHRLKRTRERTNETASPIEDQCGMFNGFARNTLLSSSGFFRFNSDDDNPFAFQTSYNIFPNYVTFTTSLESRRWPVLGMSLEAFYAGKLEEDAPGFARFITG